MIRCWGNFSNENKIVTESNFEIEKRSNESTFDVKIDDGGVPGLLNNGVAANVRRWSRILFEILWNTISWNWVPAELDYAHLHLFVFNLFNYSVMERRFAGISCYQCLVFWFSFQEAPGQWVSLDSELEMRGAEIIGTKKPTGHSLFIDCHLELPFGKSAENFPYSM